MYIQYIYIYVHMSHVDFVYDVHMKYICTFDMHMHIHASLDVYIIQLYAYTL